MFETEIDGNYIPESGLPEKGPVFFAKENIVSEQTFQVIFQVTSSTPPSSTQTIDSATRNEDFLFAGGDLFIARVFPPNVQRIPFEFTLLTDDLPEELEAFRVLSSSGGEDNIEGELPFPQFSNPLALFSDTFVIIEDDDGK